MIVSIYANEVHNLRDERSEQICSACANTMINGMIALSINEREDFWDQECNYFVDNLVPCLLEGIVNRKCTHNAYLALKCLRLLVRQSSWACNKARDSSIRSLIEQAELYGQNEHFDLEKAASSTIDILQSQSIVI